VLTSTSCSGFAGQRVFRSAGTAATGSAKGFAITFTLEEVASALFFEAALRKGVEVIHMVSDGPL